MSDLLYSQCLYCGSKACDKRFLATCSSCETALKYHKPSSITEAIKFLIGFYRQKYNLSPDVKSELLSGGMPVADQQRRVYDRVAGERKIRALTMAYKFNKLILDLVDTAPEEQLRLRITYKPSRKKIEK